MNNLASPFISVIIPTYNRAQLLPKAIGSVLAQTWRALEVILVDDNSSDDTEEVVKGFTDNRIRYIRRPKTGGGSAARNTGIRSAVGQFIGFLDDDDEWEPIKLARQLDAIADCDAVLCGVRLKRSGRFTDRFKSSAVELNHLKRGYVTGGGTSTILAKSQVLREISFDEELPCYQDWDLVIRLARKYKVKYLRDPFVIFNTGSHSRITNAIINASFEDIEKRMRAVYKHRELLGEFWCNYHRALMLLPYIKRRNNKVTHLLETIRRCGIRAVSLAYMHRLRGEMSNLWWRVCNNKYQGLRSYD